MDSLGQNSKMQNILFEGRIGKKPFFARSSLLFDALGLTNGFTHGSQLRVL